jgi:peptidyl-prolyl cis-trans isomerase SurA
MHLFRLCLSLVGLLAFGALVASASPARAQENLRIIAIVNEDMLSALDLSMRMRMAILASRLADTAEVRQRLAPQVLRTLIDEQIKKQEAARQNISIPDRAVEERLAALAAENNMSPEEFGQMLSTNGVPIQVLADQIRTELAWGQVVRRRFLPSVAITAEDVAEARNRLMESQGESEYLISEIFLPVDDPAQSASPEEAARRLLEEVRKGGDFAAVARQFSQAPSAARGGDLGWVRRAELAPEIGAVLADLQPGQIAGPVRSEGGFHVLLLRNRRESAGSVAVGTVDMKQVLFPLEDGATPAQVESAVSDAQGIRAQIASCGDAAEAAAAADALTGDLDGIDIVSLPGVIQSVAIGQPIGQPSEPIRVEDGIALFVVCARDIATEGPTDAEIRDQILRDRMEMMSRGYLRDLRRAAFVDIRG